MMVFRLKAFATLLCLVLACSCKKIVAEEEAPKAANESVYDFEGDSIWIKTYRKLHNGLMAPPMREVFNNVVEKTDYDLGTVAFFNLINQNANCDSLTIYHFLVKYPFAKKAHVINKYNELIEMGLLKKDNSYQYSLTNEGRTLSNEIESTVKSTEIDNKEEVDEIVRILAKISRNAVDEKFTGFNWSLKERLNATVRYEDAPGVFPRLVTATRDLVALRNDQAHYGLYFLDGKYDDLHISRAENELLGAAWYRNTLDPSSMLARLTWGHDLEETNAMVESLMSKNLLKVGDSLVVPTPLGERIIDESSVETDKHFYEPWRRLTKEEVKTLVDYLNG